ncbi:MAG: PcfJ domain-containing protein [Ruminococcus flavefaciens]|nr:PcfJ domain-containing protein [Ruminococcus flavefaciens]
MKAENIKPIPKHIEKRIRELDKIRCPEQKGLRFYAYLTTIKKELVKITVAMRNKGKSEQLIKQVAVHGVYSDICLVRDLEYCYLGIYAYRVGWYDEGIKYRYDIRPYYNDGKWYSVDFKYYNPYAEVVNIELALKYFPYSAVDILKPACPITYLRKYTKYPQAEYLIKAGLGKFVRSKMILELIGKDKRFCKWLMANKEALVKNPYYIPVVIRSYKTGKPLDELQAYKETVIILKRQRNLPALRKAFKDDLDQLIDYVSIQKTGVTTYNDYFTACTYLGLDMTVPKNRYPHDFKRWHDIRIDEYRTAMAIADEEQRKELYEKFKLIAEKYLTLQRNLNDAFIVVIAKSPAELIKEGDILHHCVGRMNYDQRMIREESLIFFIRNAAEPDLPFVTVEYSVANKKVLQCYGDYDTRPSQEVLDFVNDKWLPFANKKLNKITATTIAA